MKTTILSILAIMTLCMAVLVQPANGSPKGKTIIIRPPITRPHHPEKPHVKEKPPIKKPGSGGRYGVAGGGK